MSVKKENFDLTTTPEEQSAYMRMALDGFDCPPIDISDPSQVEKRIREYFDYCGSHGMRPCVSGLCNRLGIHRNTFLAWANGRERKETHQQIALRARGLIEEMTEMLMMNNKINVVAAIFILKNHFGYTDKQEISVDTKNSVTTPTSMEDVMKLCDNDGAIEVDFEDVTD